MATTESDQHGSHAPDVSVIVAVYNTMPYLTKCLDSLVDQSLGRRRLEIVAVDDGSTDDSPQELARFAAKYPGVFTVVRQENSGGPATPSNRGLDLAKGRYVFFIGADDYLGREALARMVAAGDTYGADVIGGRMVGEGGRYVPQEIFATTNTDVDLYHSAMPFAVSNTKLFRRELLERHGIRYPEDMPVGSDQPFTVAALVHAKRIVMLGDYDYYFAIKRQDRANITYSSTHELRLECTGRIMDATAALLEPGERRDAVIYRSFYNELAKLTRNDFRWLDRDVQERVCVGIGKLAEQYMTDGIRQRLDVSRRVRLSLAQRGLVDELITAVRQNVGKKPLKFVRDESGLYRWYPFFRDERGLPDEWFLLTDKPAEMMACQLVVKSIVWKATQGGDHEMIVTASSPFTPADLEAASFSAIAGDAHARVTYKSYPDRPTTTVRMAWSLRDLTTTAPTYSGRIDAFARTGVFQAPLRLPALLERPEMFGRFKKRGYFIAPIKQPDGEFAVDFRAATPEEFRQNVKLQSAENRARMRRRVRGLIRRAIPLPRS